MRELEATDPTISAKMENDLDDLLAEHCGEVDDPKSEARKQENAAHDAKRYAERVEEVRDRWHQRTLAAEAELADLKEAARIQEEGWEAERAAMRAGEEAMRAEMERLVEDHSTLLAEVEAWKTAAESARQQIADLNAERFTLLDKVSAARDAALEEAAVELARAKASEARSRWTGGLERGERLLVEEQHAIRALKSQPAERYLRGSEVQKVLSDLWNADRDRIPSSGLAAGDGVLEEAARRLGVDLDTKPAPEGDIYERGGFVSAKEER